jgi:hypothetical protein
MKTPYTASRPRHNTSSFVFVMVYLLCVWGFRGRSIFDVDFRFDELSFKVFGSSV